MSGSWWMTLKVPGYDLWIILITFTGDILSWQLKIGRSLWEEFCSKSLNSTAPTQLEKTQYLHYSGTLNQVAGLSSKKSTTIQSLMMAACRQITQSRNIGTT
jgi:hypothetical protein